MADRRGAALLAAVGAVLAACGQSTTTTGRPYLFLAYSSNFSAAADGARSSPIFQVTQAGDYLVTTTFTSLDCPLYARQDGEELVAADGTAVNVPGAVNVREYLSAGTWRVTFPYASTASCVESVRLELP